MDNDTINCEPEQTEEVTEEDKKVSKDNKTDVEIGKIVFVSCAAGSEETNLDEALKTEESSSEANSDKVNDGKNVMFSLLFYGCLNLLLVVFVLLFVFCS